MQLTTFGSLTWLRAVDRLDLLAPSTAMAIEAWARVDPRVADAVGVAEIDPELADTAAMTEAYDLPLAASANCVLVSGRREGVERIAAAVVRATTRADVNNVVRRALDVRKCSFLDHDRAVAETGMEYGGITPVGLPADWRLLVDQVTTEIELAVIGSGVRGSKLFLPGLLLSELPGAEIVPDLAR